MTAKIRSTYGGGLLLLRISLSLGTANGSLPDSGRQPLRWVEGLSSSKFLREIAREVLSRFLGELLSGFLGELVGEFFSELVGDCWCWVLLDWYPSFHGFERSLREVSLL